MKSRFLISSFFLTIQVGLIVYARVTPVRFFCWAPYDIQTKYEISAIINDNVLGPKELEQRYKYSMEGWEQRSIFNIFSIIEQYETTYGKSDAVKVKAKYSINGHSEKTWTYEN